MLRSLPPLVPGLLLASTLNLSGHRWRSSSRRSSATTAACSSPRRSLLAGCVPLPLLSPFPDAHLVCGCCFVPSAWLALACRGCAFILRGCVLQVGPMSPGTPGSGGGSGGGKHGSHGSHGHSHGHGHGHGSHHQRQASDSTPLGMGASPFSSCSELAAILPSRVMNPLAPPFRRSLQRTPHSFNLNEFACFVLPMRRHAGSAGCGAGAPDAPARELPFVRARFVESCA